METAGFGTTIAYLPCKLKMKIGGNRSREARAFTIAEVIVAVAIVAIAAAGLMGCIGHSFLITQMTRENQRATQIILERSEAIRLCSWDQVCSNGFIPTTFSDYYDPSGGNNAKGAVYSGVVSLTSVPFNTSYSTNMRQLTMAVTWKTGSINRSRTNITYISKDGIQNYVY
jgi:prepilin-type N-terminal cleavage/methylation domain-containing protein